MPKPPTPGGQEMCGDSGLGCPGKAHPTLSCSLSIQQVDTNCRGFIYPLYGQ